MPAPRAAARPPRTTAVSALLAVLLALVSTFGITPGLADATPRAVAPLTLHSPGPDTHPADAPAADAFRGGPAADAPPAAPGAEPAPTAAPHADPPVAAWGAPARAGHPETRERPTPPLTGAPAPSRLLPAPLPPAAAPPPPAPPRPTAEPPVRHADRAPPTPPGT